MRLLYLWKMQEMLLNFYCKDAPRTRVSKSVKEIITIEGEVNKPSMYIINYDNEQGFLLVSATKNFQPILAYAERGSFNANNRMPDGLSDWLGDMKNVIEERDKMPIDSTFQYRAMWEEYIPAMKDKVYTRSNIAEFENYIADCCREWKRKAMDIFRLLVLGIICRKVYTSNFVLLRKE